jgi:hypothetical protein
MNCFPQEEDLFVYETQQVSPRYMEDLDRDFPKDGVQQIKMKMEINKATDFDWLPAEVWKTFCTTMKETITIGFNKVKNRKDTVLQWKEL